MANRRNVDGKAAIAAAAARAAHAARRPATPHPWRAILVVGFAAMATLGCGRETYYSADAITARVVDADTNQPLAGVNVVAGWEVKGGLEGGNTMGWVMVMEAVTDATGTFTFPAWGPKRLNVSGAITDGSPVLLLFKSGYAYQRVYDHSRRVGELAPSSRDEGKLNPIHSYWNGRTIPLQQFAEGNEQYAEHLQRINDDVASLVVGNECNLRALPKFLWAVDQQSKVFGNLKTKWQVRGIESLELTYSSQCGALQNFVEGRRK